MTGPRPYANAIECDPRGAFASGRASGSPWRGFCSRSTCSGPSHVTAEQLHNEALGAEVPVSLATVYNALHQFVAAGLLREVVVNPGRSYFDTNVSNHHHFFHEEAGQLSDIAGDRIEVSNLPEPPAGTKVRRVDVIIRVGGNNT